MRYGFNSFDVTNKSADEREHTINIMLDLYVSNKRERGTLEYNFLAASSINQLNSNKVNRCLLIHKRII